MSVTCAPRAHGGERFVTRRVEERDGLVPVDRDVVRADVLRDATGFARDDVCLPDMVEERGLSVVDVAHDGHDRRTRDQLRLRVDDRGRRIHCLVHVFANRREAEFTRDELDLVEVETQVDGHHQAERLERERHDLGRGDLDDLRELVDRDELVDANELLLPLGLGGACCLELLASATAKIAGVAARGRAAHSRHRPRNVRLDGLLIDRSALALFPATAIRAGGGRLLLLLTGLPVVATLPLSRWTTRRGRRNRTWTLKATAAACAGTWTRRPRGDGTRTNPIRIRGRRRRRGRWCRSVVSARLHRGSIGFGLTRLFGSGFGFSSRGDRGVAFLLLTGGFRGFGRDLRLARGFCGGGFVGGSLLGGGCLNIGRFAAAPNWLGGGDGLGWRRRRCFDLGRRLGDRRPTLLGGCRRGGGLRRTRPLLTFPPRANTRDLVVGQRG
jgi:hypothetical protein